MYYGITYIPLIPVYAMNPTIDYSLKNICYKTFFIVGCLLTKALTDSWIIIQQLWQWLSEKFVSLCRGLWGKQWLIMFLGTNDDMRDTKAVSAQYSSIWCIRHTIITFTLHAIPSYHIKHNIIFNNPFSIIILII